jgi:hypothetical protein
VSALPPTRRRAVARFAASRSPTCQSSLGELHSTDPDRSPNSLAITESRLRLHVRPWFADRPIERIGPADVRRWQRDLAPRSARPPQGRTATRATIDRALAELAAAGAAAIDPQTQRWALRPAARHPLLEVVDLHGAHDFRHTFSTWLQDAGIPARVIDELMGHQSGWSGLWRLIPP